jgi:hypothetical protein
MPPVPENLAKMKVAVRDHPDGAILDIHVQPKASRTEWVGLHGEALKYRIAAPPAAGVANAALCAYLAGQFGIAGSRVKLLRGQTARRKQVLLRGLSAQRALQILQSFQ